VKDLRSMPWWTPADAAELDLLVHELVDDVYEHRQDCERCAAGHPPCPWVNAAIKRVAEWREDRMLRSRAAWLRAGQDRLEAGA
jgi:hypothetical protein